MEICRKIWYNTGIDQRGAELEKSNYLRHKTVPKIYFAHKAEGRVPILPYLLAVCPNRRKKVWRNSWAGACCGSNFAVQSAVPRRHRPSARAFYTAPICIRQKLWQKVRFFWKVSKGLRGTSPPLPPTSFWKSSTKTFGAFRKGLAKPQAFAP